MDAAHRPPGGRWRSQTCRATKERPKKGAWPITGCCPPSIVPFPPGVNAAGFGSDVVADALRATDIPYIALNPGASYRGFHDSLVNYLGNERPQMLLCLHEESAIAIAHGYAKVTGKAMAAAVHSNVGLMHGTMAIFNAWCDRMPMVILGATGPVDAVKRRPWIDWIHTARDQGALVRGYTKWDDQPASPAAAREAVLRANWIANTAPRGPTYVNLDAEMQESKLGEPVAPIDAKRFMPPVDSAAPADLVRQAADLLRNAKRPVILAGRVSRDPRRMESAHCACRAAQRARRHRPEDRRVVPDRPSTARGCARRHCPGTRGSRRHSRRRRHPQPRLARCRRHFQEWAASHRQGRSGLRRPPTAQRLEHGLPGPAAGRCVHRTASRMLRCHRCSKRLVQRSARGRAAARAKISPNSPTTSSRSITLPSRCVMQLANGRPSLTHVSLSWNGANWAFDHPLDYLGSDGGGGVGGGPGISVGAALALKGSGRLPVAVCGDGDFLMGVTALWTAAHYRIPLLIVVANNRSFFNDELHQERVARMRNRPIENRWVGQRISEPDIDLAGMARAQGAQGFGPVTSIADLAPTFTKAIAAVEAGAVAVVDVRVEPGYTAATTAAMTRKSE